MQLVAATALRASLRPRRPPIASVQPEDWALRSTGWEGPGLLQSGFRDLSYWDLHGFLLIPTLWLLTAGSPSLMNDKSNPLKRDASFGFVAFILSIAVGQAFIWDSVGAQIGIWEFNPEKCTGLGEKVLLPLEEILWLFHHVIKAALWQIKMSDVNVVRAPPGTLPSPMAPQVRTAGNLLLFMMSVGGVVALLGQVDEAKCIGLVAAFFAPVLTIIYNLGSRYFASHWRLFVGGWIVPGWWTVFIDCIGQQQQVWRFPPMYLSGVATLDGLLKLDIALVYLVSTLAVTATGAIVVAAADEFERVRNSELIRMKDDPEVLGSGRPCSWDVSDGAISVARNAGEHPSLWDLGLFIFENAFEGSASTLQTLVSRMGDDAQQGQQLNEQTHAPPSRKEQRSTTL